MASELIIIFYSIHKCKMGSYAQSPIGEWELCSKPHRAKRRWEGCAVALDSHPRPHSPLGRAMDEAEVPTAKTNLYRIMW